MINDTQILYYRKDTGQLYLEDLFLLAAMGPPGGGRNHVTHRLLRHFNLIGIESFDEDTMRNIFAPIIDWHFNQGFDNSLKRNSRVGKKIFHLFQILPNIISTSDEFTMTSLSDKCIHTDYYQCNNRHLPTSNSKLPSNSYKVTLCIQFEGLC